MFIWLLVMLWGWVEDLEKDVYRLGLQLEIFLFLNGLRAILREFFCHMEKLGAIGSKVDNAICSLFSG